MERHEQSVEALDDGAMEIVLRLFATDGIGTGTMRRILEDTVGKGEELGPIMGFSAQELTRRYQVSFDSAQIFLTGNDLSREFSRRIREQGIRVLLKGTTAYPSSLANALGKSAPPVLFVLGNAELLQMPAVGFCGSRNASEKGLAATAGCAEALAAEGINVVSGYAHGVDLAAHRAALGAGGVTTIVQAEGITKFRLKAGIKDLANEENLLILSTFSPGLPWSARQAMARNRTICGLSNAVILVESGEEGGTFQAGEAALALRLPLFVVDFAKPAPSATGNSYFLKRGAMPLRRSRNGRPNLEQVLSAVQHPHRNDNTPLGGWQSTADMALTPKAPAPNRPKKCEEEARPADDRRLIEDYLPIKAISAEASREKSIRKGHISTLHLWWARRPLVACRAAVYGALVPLSRFRPENGPEEKRDSLARANAAKFVERLCKYPGNPSVIKEAQRHILEAHAERLARELAQATETGK